MGLASSVVPLEHPSAADLDLANATGLVVSRCEAAAFHRSVALDRAAYWDEIRDQLEAADAVSATDLLSAFDHCDVLCLPTVGVQPPMRDDFTRFLTVLSRNCVPFSLAGFPAVSVPCGVDPDGFPVGLQIVGPPGADARVIAAAAAVEAAAGDA
jgi:aspartyl-tRNA(Asn)/glutamyl-tRNA(Gln) amidotransferase subunit A